MQYSSLPTIWRNSAHTFKQQLWVYGIGCVVFGSLMSSIVYNTMMFIETFFAQSTMLKQLGAVDLASGLQSGSLNTEQLLNQLSALSPQSVSEQINMQEFALQLFTELAPIMIIALLLIAVVVFIALKYYLIAACKPNNGARAVFISIFKYILPEFFLSAYVFMRSFAWVPLIGPILALIFTPRYTLAGIYLVRDHLGIFTSAKKSFAQTKGHWLHIVKSVYITFLVASLLYIIVRIIIGLMPLPALVTIVITAILSQISLAFCTIAMVHIGEELMDQQPSSGIVEAVIKITH